MITVKAKVFPFFILLLAAMLFITPFLNKDIMVDEDLIITPLRSVQSISDYIEKLQTRKIPDFQPLRDITHFLDITIEKTLNFSKIHLLTNFVLFLLTVLSYYFFLRNYISFMMAKVGSILLTVHPAFIQPFYEPTQRKHILSLLFLILTLNLIVVSKRKIPSLGTYFLMLSSHIINAFIPLIWITEKRRSTRSLIPFALVLALFALANLFMYKVFFFENDKAFYSLDWSKLAIAISLFFRQFFFPFKFSTYYSLSDIRNLGFLLPGLLFFILLFKKNRNTFFFVTLSILSIFLTLYTNKSNIYNLYYYNSYFLGFGVILLTGILVILKDSLKGKRIWFSIPVILTLYISSLYYSSIRTDKYSLYQKNFELEPNCRLAEWLSVETIKQGRLKNVGKYPGWWMNNKCQPQLQKYTFFFIQAHFYLEHPSISYEQKKVYIENVFPNKLDQFILQTYLAQRSDILFDENNFIQKLPKSKMNSVFIKNSYIPLQIKSKIKTDQNKDQFEKFIHEMNKKPIAIEFRGLE